ncbi:AAA family ATPase [Pseudomonas oryzihabitans]|uniref:AAA family ATPase n=1 Tax=Pseudomonas oryzihabitans TaxID=47885 RepID=UPI0009ECE637|nr:AAA family ATPase [Pseudomonas oryzihabitans]
MIFSVILRNFKTYQGINYIPLSNGTNFAALVGENGAGKSSVLEALSSYFNSSDWNFHHSLQKGFAEREPYICPIFLFEKKRFPDQSFEWLCESINNLAWNTKITEFASANKIHAEAFNSHRQKLISQGYTAQSHILLPLGLIKNHKNSTPTPYFSIFETVQDFSALKNYKTYTEALAELYKTISQSYSYIYLPSEIDIREQTKLESKTMQAVLGKKIDHIVRGFIDKTTITDINNKLSEFLEEISARLITYEYRKPGLKQSLLNITHLTETIIDSYFGSKVLTQKSGKNSSTPVADLSSGEKRQALIDVAQAFLSNSNQESKQNIILAIDEPELSLHTSACFNQFEKLTAVSQNGPQVLITTHWYGFMPVVTDGSAIYCSKKVEVSPILLDLRCFREELKKIRRDTQGKLPTEIELKGTNDLVQSIVSSITAGDYKWIICEGSSDKIYLDHHISCDKTFIVAIGGSFALKKLYTYLDLALSENREDINGRVFLLLDTDKKYESFEKSHNIDQIQIKRIKNNEATQKTELLDTSNNDFHPATTIEDALKPSYFFATLKKFITDETHGDAIRDLIQGLSVSNDDIAPSFALNLRRMEILELDEIFSTEGFKVKFALEYIKIAPPENPPHWIRQIKEFIEPSPLKTKRRRRN